MFTRKLELSGEILLRNLSRLDSFCLLTIPHRQRHYAKLTDDDQFTGKYVITINPTELTDQIPETSPTPGGELQALKGGTPNWFIAGWIGLLDYPSDDQRAIFRRYSESLLVDPGATYCLLQSYKPITEQVVAEYRKVLNNCLSETTTNTQKRTWTAEQSQTNYRASFDRVREYLLSGDCYQINLATPFHCKDDLRNCAPYHLLNLFDAPHGCIIKDGERTIISVSPERLLKVTPTIKGDTNTQQLLLETRPIKGTAPRHPEPSEDDRLASSLRESPKNLAENLMIVDLLRNDLSIHAEPGSVAVPELFTLESHSNVHHLVSTITATLKANTSPSEAIKATFPGGSITGAPKKRAMEIIKELEPRDRGAYCGSAGFIDDSGHCDFNILIRTIEAKKEGAICWGGGGLVIDSNAEDEYQEILNKVTKILDTPL